MACIVQELLRRQKSCALGHIAVACASRPPLKPSLASPPSLCLFRPARRHRLNRVGDRQLNRASSTVVIWRVNHHAETEAHTAPPRAEGRTDRDIRRCPQTVPRSLGVQAAADPLTPHESIPHGRASSPRSRLPSWRTNRCTPRGRIVNQGACDADPLLLATGQLLWKKGEPISETKPAQQVFCLSARSAVFRRGQFGNHGDVLQRRKRAG